MLKRLAYIILGVSLAALLLTRVGTAFAPFVPPAPEISISTEGASLIPDSAVIFYGNSSLPDGTCLQTQLLIDGEPLSGWPADTCATVQDGTWLIRVPLGEGYGTAGLFLNEGYKLNVWQEGDFSVQDIWGPGPSKVVIGR